MGVSNLRWFWVRDAAERTMVTEVFRDKNNARCWFDASEFGDTKILVFFGLLYAKEVFQERGRKYSGINLKPVVDA